MGYNTTILFLNDAAGHIEKNPEQVVQNILSAMNHTGRKSKTFSFGEAMPTAHADVTRLYMTEGNSIVEFGPYSNSMPNLKYRKQWLKRAKEILKDEEREIKRLEAESE